MDIGFYGAAGSVTGSCFLLRVGDARYLIDCGFFQGSQRLEERNAEPFGFDAAEVDTVVLTHAHIDHCGRLPLLVKRGFKGRVVTTRATRDIAEPMLLDSAHIQESDAERDNRKLRRAGEELVTALYDEETVRRSLERLDGVSYQEEVTLGPGVTMRLVDAGHILGSAFVELTVVHAGTTRRITFSGDVGNHGKAIVRDPFTPSPCDVILTESTYGNRDHKPQPETLVELAQAINDSVGNGGIALIPAFALGRTQEILYHLRALRLEGKIPKVPVYVDSPLAIAATEAFRKNPDCFDEETRALLSEGESPFEYPQLRFTRSSKESMALNDDDSPRIVVASSGMATAGRIRHHIKHHAWKEKTAIIFCGYQAQGTLGRMLVDGVRDITMFGERIRVRATVHTLGGFSAHADCSGLMEWVRPPAEAGAHVIVTHGEPETSAEYAQRLQDELGAKTTVPAFGDTFEL